MRFSAFLCFCILCFVCCESTFYRPAVILNVDVDLEIAKEALLAASKTFDVSYDSWEVNKFPECKKLVDKVKTLNQTKTVVVIVNSNDICQLATTYSLTDVLVVKSINSDMFMIEGKVFQNWESIIESIPIAEAKVWSLPFVHEKTKSSDEFNYRIPLLVVTALLVGAIIIILVLFLKRHKRKIAAEEKISAKRNMKPSVSSSRQSTTSEKSLAEVCCETVPSHEDVTTSTRESAGEDPSRTKIAKRPMKRIKWNLGNEALVPVSGTDFMKHLDKVGKHCVAYYKDPTHFNVTTDKTPGFLYNEIPRIAPQNPEKFDQIFKDFNQKILPGLTHWQHPRFHAFFNTGRNYPIMLAELAISSIGVVGFSWDSAPSVTELENAMMNWVGRALGLPESFLFQGNPADSPGGGTIFDSSSDITFCTLVASRQRKIKELAKREIGKTKENGVSYDMDEMHEICRRLVAYTSKDAHSCIEKGAKIAMIRCRPIQAKAENDWGITGEELEKEILKDIEKGLIPSHVHVTLGTTSTAASDHLDTIWPVAEKYNMWIHVDAAYSGGCWLNEKYRTNCAGLEHAHSVNANGHKMLMHTVGHSFFWTRFQKEYKDAFAITPIFLKPTHASASDLRDWSVHLTRRFNSLKTWFFFRMYGLDGLANYVERLVTLAEYFEKLVAAHPNCRIFHKRNFSLFCFQYVEPGMSEDEINIATQRLCQFMNESHQLFFTFTRVAGISLIRVSVTWEKSTKETIDDSWNIMKEMIEEFKPIKNDVNLLKQRAGTPLPGHTKPILPGNDDDDIAGSMNESTDRTAFSSYISDHEHSIKEVVNHLARLL